MGRLARRLSIALVVGSSACQWIGGIDSRKVAAGSEDAGSLRDVTTGGVGGFAGAGDGASASGAAGVTDASMDSPVEARGDALSADASDASTANDASDSADAGDPSDSGLADATDAPNVDAPACIALGRFGCTSSGDCCEAECVEQVCVFPLCGAEGTSCAGRAQCCDVPCESGTCSACRLPQVICQQASDCCSGSCLQFGSVKTCAAPIGRSIGVACSTSSECDSLNCVGGLCRAACFETGQLCTGDVECCSLRCLGGGCVYGGCLDVGASCTAMQQCCSGSCSQGACD